MTVKRAVYSWSIRFRSAGYGNEQLALISKQYHEDLVDEGVTLKQFHVAERSVRKRCRFFPAMADILDAVKEYRECPPRSNQSGALQIEDTTSRHDLTPEEVTRNKERVGMIVGALAGRITWEEAEKGVAALQHIGEFTPDIEITSRSAT